MTNNEQIINKLQNLSSTIDKFIDELYLEDHSKKIKKNKDRENKLYTNIINMNLSSNAVNALRSQLPKYLNYKNAIDNLNDPFYLNMTDIFENKLYVFRNEIYSGDLIYLGKKRLILLNGLGNRIIMEIDNKLKEMDLGFHYELEDWLVKRLKHEHYLSKMYK